MKKMPIKKVSAIALIFLIAITFFVSKAYAATTQAGALEITYPGSGALFNETNIAPGFEVVKTVSVKNTGRVAHSFSIAVYGQLGVLANVLQIEPRNFETGVPIWNKTIRDIAKAPDSNVILGSIAPGETRQVKIAAILPESVGNEYQNTETFSFDFVVGNESTDPSESNQNSNTNSDNNISTDLRSIFAFGSNSNINRNSAYGNGNSNGNSNTSLANENSNTADTVTNIDNNQGKAAGATTTSEKICFWWWILWAIAAIFLIVYGYLVKNRRGWFFEFWPVFAGAIVGVVHWILHNYYHPSKWCGWWFVLVLLAEIIVYYIVRRQINKNQQS